MPEQKSALNNALYPGNSDKERKEEKKLPDKPVLSAAPTVRKENPFLTFYRAVFSGSIRDVKQSLWDRMVNVAKDTIYNTFVGFLDDYIYNGGGRRSYSRPSERDTNPLRYANVSKSSLTSRSEDRAYATAYSLPSFAFRTRSDAEVVLQSMIAYLDEFDFVTVKYYLELSGQENEYTDKYWGWTKEMMNNVTVKPDRDGYILTLPRPTYDR